MEETLAQTHAIVCNDKRFLLEKRGPVKCVYIIDGLYIGSTNDLKRRMREYIGRAKRNEPVRSETPIMRYIKDRIDKGIVIKFFILHPEPCREFLFINRYKNRGIKLLNVVLQWDYKKATDIGRMGLYERYREVSVKSCGRVVIRKR